MSNLLLHELAAVASVAFRHGFRAAAADLDVSPSAVSHSVASIERRLGVRLFDRDTRNVSLTLAGERFLARISPALREISIAFETTSKVRRRRPPPIWVHAWKSGDERLISVLLNFKARHPDVRLKLTVRGRSIDLAAATERRAAARSSAKKTRSKSTSKRSVR